MYDITQIAEEIYSNSKSHRGFVGNFEKHQDLIDDIDFNSTTETYNIYSQLIADYGIALSESESYKKAIPVIERALELLHKNNKYTPDTLHYVKSYEVLLFNRGVGYYYLAKYELARPDFELLIKLYPDNLVYPKWMNAIKNKNLNRIKNILWYCVAGAILVGTFLYKETLIKDIVLGLGLLSLLGAIIIETKLYLGKKKSSLS